MATPSSNPLDDLPPPNPLDALPPPRAMPVPGAAIQRQQRTIYNPITISDMERDPRSTYFNRYSPLSSGTLQLGPINTGVPLPQPLNTIATGAGAFYTDTGLRAQQAANWASGTPDQALEQQILEKRQIDQPLMSTAAGKFGYGLPAMIAGSALPGTAALATARLGIPAISPTALSAGFGTVLGGSQPTTSQDWGGNLGATVFNSALGGVTSAVTTRAADQLTRWAGLRSNEPLTGMTPEGANRQAALAVGSNASRLDKAAIAQREPEIGNIFDKYRSPNVSANVGSTSGVIDNLTDNLDQEIQGKFAGSLGVRQLTRIATDPSQSATTEELGNVSSELRKAMATQYNSSSGNPQLAGAYKDLRDHVESLIEGTIPNAQGLAEYHAVKGQYGALQDLKYNPSLLNATTGEVNAKNIGNFLQRRYEFSGHPDPINPLEVIGSWGQRTGETTGAPPMFRHPWDYATYRLANNPFTRLGGGMAAHAITATQPLTQYALPVLGSGLATVGPRETPAAEDWAVPPAVLRQAVGLGRPPEQ
jgi:hypothetical protein